MREAGAASLDLDPEVAMEFLPREAASTRFSQEKQLDPFDAGLEMEFDPVHLGALTDETQDLPSPTEGAADPSDWVFDLYLAGWLPVQLDGQVTIDGVETKFDVDIDTLLDDLDFVLEGGFSYGDDHWSLLFWGVYFALGADVSTEGLLGGEIDSSLKLKLVLLDAAITYRLGKWPLGEREDAYWAFDVLGGLRYWWIDARRHAPVGRLAQHPRDARAHSAEQASRSGGAHVVSPTSPSTVDRVDAPHYKGSFTRRVAAQWRCGKMQGHSRLSSVSSRNRAALALGIALGAGRLAAAQCDAEIVGDVDTPGFASGVVVAGDVAYVADGGAGLQVIDLTDETIPMILGSVDTPGSANDVAVSGSVAYIADDTAGLQVVDVSNPAAPAILGFVDTPGFATGVHVVGTLAYVADSTAGLQVIDVSNPASPSIVGFVDTPGFANDVVVDGAVAYVADDSLGLRTFDVSNPAMPTFMGSVNTPGFAFGVTLDGTLAYVADLTAGLQVIDVADPTTPAIIGSLGTAGNAYDVVVVGARVIVADDDAGLQVIDVTDPALPADLGSIDTPGSGYGIAVAGDTASLADGGTGLQVIALGLLVPTATFEPLGDLPGRNFESLAAGVSSDGSVIVGRGDWRVQVGEAFLWTCADGLVGLGDLAGGISFSAAWSLSFDGSVVVGFGNSASGQEAFRWTSTDGMVGLGDLPGGDFESWAFDCSADGSVVVGWGNVAAGFEAFRWTSDDGLVGLGDLPGGHFLSQAYATSADGSVVVGRSRGASGIEAFRWTSTDGMVGLGALPGGAFTQSWAWGLSADGQVVIGSSEGVNGPEAFRWTSEDGMVGLGDLPGGQFFSIVFDASSDGSIIVGRSRGESDTVRAIIWDEVGGMRSIQAILEDDFGLDLTGWTLTDARAISEDNTTIVGFCINPDGFEEAYRVVIPELPVPCTADVNDDGMVDVQDLLALLADWGPNPGSPADLDGDGVVNVVDLLELLGGWGFCPR